ncbi:MAG: hypothetical protein U0O25_08035 [Succinivibrio sp.]|uniref:hypothetical protein n=1 Tax=Succinivibrio sp. TaxID=2053619 RepID=UPI002F950825
MNKKDSEYLSHLKSNLSGSLTLAQREKLSDSLEKIYSDNAEKFNSIPTDLVALAIATECDINSYVDFHSKEKQEKSAKDNGFLAKKMSNLF